MPSGTNLFDDEDGLEPDQRSKPSNSDAVTGEPTASQRGRRSPNYLIRRAIVVGGVVAVLATASIVVGQLMTSGSDETSSGAIGSDWNRIVLVDDRTGRVIVNDADGEELSRIESGVRSPSASAIVDSRLVVTGAETLAVIDTDAETVDEFESAADQIIRPAGSALTMIAPQPGGGRALLVHGPSGDVIDTDTFAPVVGARYVFADSLSSSSGRDVLVTDSGNFQSVLVSFDRDEPSFFPGLALAIDDDLVVTAQNVGNDATINVFNHDGESVASGRTPSVRAGMIGDSGIVLITIDGAVITMSTSNGDTSDVTQLEIGTIESGDVATSGDRLVVTGATGSAVVDATASIVATLDDQMPAGGGKPPTGSACVATITSSAVDGDVLQIAVVDLSDGNVLVEAAGNEPVLTDASGCVAGVVAPDGFDLLGADGVRQFQTGDALLALSLDGQGVITERGARIVLLDAGADDTAPQDPVDLGPRAHRPLHPIMSSNDGGNTPGDERYVDIVRPNTVWRFEREFLESNWTCLFGKGCPGILDHDATELNQGCCSLGADFGDGPAGQAEAMNVDAYASMLTPEQFQFHHVARAPSDSGTSSRSDDGANGIFGDDDRTHTRVVDGACIFLNRPGFAGGEGCALHIAALDAGESPTDWKPSVCWQLPLRIDWEELDADTEMATVRRWTRADWGDHGTTMAWCCTERSDGGEAYSADEQVIDSMADSLAVIAGDEVYVELRRRL